MFVPSHARLASWTLVTQGHRNLEDSAVPTLLARATLVLPSRYYAQAEGASWRQIFQLARHEVRRAFLRLAAYLRAWPLARLDFWARFFKFFHQALCRGRS